MICLFNIAFWQCVCLRLQLCDHLCVLVPCGLQLALGHGVRRLHVSAAYRATAHVSMSRFEPTSFVNSERLRSNIDIVRKRSVSS